MTSPFSASVPISERDFRVPMNNAVEFWTALQRQGVPSKLIVWPTQNHAAPRLH